MLRSILVPLDGSEFGEHALPVARTIARATGATVYLAHVHVPSVRPTLASKPSIDTSLDAENRKGESAYLDAIPTRLSAEADLRLVPVQLEGPVAEALATYVTSNAIDLVVMTTHGRGGLSRLWLGSTANELAHRSKAPVLLIRPQETRPELTAQRTFHHILIPLDGSPLAEQVLEPVIELARLLGAACTLVHVFQPLQLIGYAPATYALNLDAQVYESLQREAEQYLATMAQRVQAGNVVAQTRILLDSQPAAGIIRAAGESGADMIALATHGRSGLARVLIGSVADKVVRSSDMPVLVIQPQASSG